MSNVRTLNRGGAQVNPEAVYYVVAKATTHSIVVWQLEIHDDWDSADQALADARTWAEFTGGTAADWDIYGLFTATA
ncbi:hypothetical protein ACFROC_29175 [Nocardia tengchongensis]|uniref:hypothetical protein n=1 Tax=Nocardia tengchongensis TaxID=2055889 RepID=UPI0036C57728